MNSEKIELAKSKLSPDELERAYQFQQPKHQDRYIRGRSFLRSFLANQLDIDATAIEFQYGQRGKPELKGNSNLTFNLSHSGELAIAACSSSLDAIGIDLELVDRRVDYASLCKHYFNTGEITWILDDSLTESQQKRRFLQVWTAKEARMKLFGEGLYLEPKAIEVRFNEDLPVEYLTPTQPPLTSFHTNRIQSAVGAVTATDEFAMRWVDTF